MANEASTDSTTKLCECITQIRMNAAGDAIERVFMLMPCLDSIKPLTWAMMA